MHPRALAPRAPIRKTSTCVQLCPSRRSVPGPTGQPLKLTNRRDGIAARACRSPGSVTPTAPWQSKQVCPSSANTASTLQQQHPTPISTEATLAPAALFFLCKGLTRQQGLWDRGRCRRLAAGARRPPVIQQALPPRYGHEAILELWRQQGQQLLGTLQQLGQVITQGACRAGGAWPGGAGARGGRSSTHQVTSELGRQRPRPLQAAPSVFRGAAGFSTPLRSRRPYLGRAPASWAAAVAP